MINCIKLWVIIECRVISEREIGDFLSFDCGGNSSESDLNRVSSERVAKSKPGEYLSFALINLIC
jgi:hypothetical protein